MMNLRIEGQHLRFRISKGELEQLCQGVALVQRTHLPESQSLEIVIATGHEADEFQLNYQRNTMRLTVSEDAAKNLLFSLPAREGIEAVQVLESDDRLQLSLEVDIRTQKRKKA